MFNKNRFKSKSKVAGMAAVVTHILAMYKIPATTGHIRDTLLNHPDFPSLLSLAESLSEWGVSTRAVKGTINDLSEADFQGIALLRSNDYVVLDDMDETHVKIIDPNTGGKTLTLDMFSQIWSGVILRVSPQEGAGESDYQSHRRSQYLSKLQKFIAVIGLPLVALAAFFYGLIYYSSSNSMVIPLGLIKVAGLMVCAMMVSKSIGESALLQRICPSGKVVNCSRVMDSPAGKILGVPMADLGLVYFTGTAAAMFLASSTGQMDAVVFLLGILTLTTLPYTLFSIAYQALVIRSWCWLCLIVQALFWLEFAVLYGAVSQGIQQGHWALSYPFIIAFVITVLSWITLKPLLSKSMRHQELEAAANRMRRQPEYIGMLFSKARTIDPEQFPFEVEVGPTDAPVILTQVVNPMCGHCGKAFEEMTQLIELGKGNVKGVVRFLVKNKADNMTKTEKKLDHEVATGIIALAAAGKHDLVLEALKSWFDLEKNLSKRNYLKWRAKYVSSDEPSMEIADTILKGHREWAVKNSIIATPVLFMGRRFLPPGISFGDLKYFLMRQFK